MGLLKSFNRISDIAIIEAIEQSTVKEDECLSQLYKDNFRPILSLVSKNNGGEEEAKEVLQTAIIVLYERIKKGGFELKAKLSTFLFSVAKNQWYNQLKENGKTVSSNEFSQAAELSYEIKIDNYDANAERKKWVVSLMNQLKPDCKEVLVYSVYQKYSMKEIAEMMGFKNEQIARNKKAKCLNYFKRIVVNHQKESHIMAS